MAGLSRAFSFGDRDEESLDPQRGYRDGPPSSPPPLYNDSLERQNDRPPAPPQHRSNGTPAFRLPQIDTGTVANQDLDHSLSYRTASTVTPGADNLGEAAAGGGLEGIALGIANAHARESGVEAMRSVQSLDRIGSGLPAERSYDTSDTPYIPALPNNRLSQTRDDPFASPAPSRRSNPFDDNRRGSLPPSPGQMTPRAQGYPSQDNIPLSEYPPRDAYANSRNSSYLDNPYNRYSTAWDTRVAQGDIDPNQLDDVDEDGIPATGHGGLGNTAAGGAMAGGIVGALGGLVGRKNHLGSGAQDASGHYGPVGGQVLDGSGVEKSDWLKRQTSGRKRFRWIVGILIALAVIGAIVAGAIGGTRHNSPANGDSSSSSTQGKSAAEDDSSGDLDKDSAEIKKLMGNTKLHKVFPGMDYTPFNAQYPACLTNPPSQNNITRDMAVLSQLTNTVRLYGTDCNQTDMVLHSIKKLGLTDVKVWLGVWLDSNATSTDRGLKAMYDILSRNGVDPFAGVIVGNEVLYRKDMTELQLGEILSGVKKNFTSLNYNLPLATADLGDDWTAGLAANVDVVMSNIHPFFAGVTAETGAGWTWDFWQTHDTTLTQGGKQKNIIAETGWPSGGGTDCGEATTCATGSVAGIDEMNTFMGSFICQGLANGTNFFWFEAFDEPWKVSLNTPGKEWEDKWGLMDPGRNLKPGLKIPDCGGKTVS